MAGVGGRWRVEGGLDGTRSPFSWLGVACPIETRGKHEWSVSVWPPDIGLKINMYEYKGRFGLQLSSSGAYSCHQAEFQRYSIAVGAPILSNWRTTATVSPGLHARRATGLTGAEREERLSFTRAESVAR